MVKVTKRMPSNCLMNIFEVYLSDCANLNGGRCLTLHFDEWFIHEHEIERLFRFKLNVN